VVGWHCSPLLLLLLLLLGSCDSARNSCELLWVNVSMCHRVQTPAAESTYQCENNHLAAQLLNTQLAYIHLHAITVRSAVSFSLTDSSSDLQACHFGSIASRADAQCDSTKVRALLAALVVSSHRMIVYSLARLCSNTWVSLGSARALTQPREHASHPQTPCQITVLLLRSIRARHHSHPFILCVFLLTGHAAATLRLVVVAVRTKPPTPNSRSRPCVCGLAQTLAAARLHHAKGSL